jgi:uncharacterized membrane protein YfcA
MSPVEYFRNWPPHMKATQAALLLAICAIASWFCYRWWRLLRTKSGGIVARPSLSQLLVGFVTNFFDTLGISSFATTAALYRLRRMVSDELIPGTLNVGHAAPTFTQALVFIAAVAVEPGLLVSMIAAAVAGAWVGAGVVVRLGRRPIQLGMGIALLLAGCLFALVSLGLLPGGGDALALGGWKFGLAIGANFIYGALMPLGVGLFGPCMITLALLGMNPIAAFPIMMASCAFLMPVASLQFLEKGRYSCTAALGLTAGGVPAVLIAAYVVKSLPLATMRWMVAGVVLCVSISMLRSAYLRTETLSYTAN